MDYKKLGKEAVRRYFDRTDESPDENLLEEIIKDIAEREKLNNQMIARVCQFANVKIFLRLFKATNDKTVEFDVAVPENIIDNIEDPIKKNDTDLPFDDSYYIIESNEESEEKEGDKSSRINITELIDLVEKIKEERDNLEIKLFEEKPKMMKLLSTKLRKNNPKYVTYGMKTAGASEEFIKEACDKAGLEDLPDISKIEEKDPLVDDKNEFLQKISSYVKMKNRFKELEKKLEKSAGILRTVGSTAGSAVKHPFTTLRGISSVSKIKDRAKDFEEELSTEDLDPSKTTIEEFEGQLTKNQKGGKKLQWT